jgi:hypothetical protein
MLASLLHYQANSASKAEAPPLALDVHIGNSHIRLFRRHYRTYRSTINTRCFDRSEKQAVKSVVVRQPRFHKNRGRNFSVIKKSNSDIVAPNTKLTSHFRNPSLCPILTENGVR